MIFNRRRFMAAVCGALAAALVLPADGVAGTASTTFNVTANVDTACIVSATNVAFGTYNAAQLDGTGSISVTCTNLAPYTVELDAGTGPGATVASRIMSGPVGQTLTYSLYQKAARTTLWGSVGALQAVAGVGTGSAQSLTVYGRVPASQTPAAGAYSDTVTVTVAY